MKLIKFYAEWCGPCKVFAPVLEKVAKDKNIDLQNINIEEHEQLSDKWGVKSIPVTILTDNAGIELRRIVGNKTEAELNKFIEGEDNE